jgi:acetylornithine deacetylase/succinyl-diaminopimelate desuccinylase-like protein
MIDWRALGAEAVDLLRAYLRIDTTNPPGNEIAGARFLADVLRADGIESHTVESAPGRANLVARLSGDGSLGGIVLHHHVDVVYADRRYWTVDPFGGDIKDGFLYGRGALDMKSTGILQLAALLALKRAGARLTRDLVFLATADEEAGSAFGAQFVAARHPEWLAGAEYALTELGGIEIDARHRAPFAHVVISEKTGLPLCLTARDTPGHGSMPWPDTAPHRLIRALGRLLAAERPPRVLPEVQEYFRALARVLPPDEGRGLDDLQASFRDPTFRARFFARRDWAAMVRTTFAVNMLRASEKLNVIPPEAVADIDCRVLAGDDPQDLVEWVRRAVDDDHVQVALAREPKVPNLSPPDTAMYKALADTLARRAPGVVVAPEILVAFTDSWVFRRMGLQAYGWSPFVLDEGEWRRVHGNDERISLPNLTEGVRAYTELLLQIAGA